MGGDGGFTTTGPGDPYTTTEEDTSDADENVKACYGKSEGASCKYSGKTGICVQGTWTSL
jgi:hypothetical protein